ncbi:30S ribosomal protein S11 [Candidatus Shapirobacteria bacterium RBG_13_44_7]|uniref:Small ribosomal subunit protein uS11 n=1 Tax=Candidatus Shapirobacteria bacterium RBG_13_44_7 TaxID=1802149 RepID=A0A1F7SK12_9BACT|nr:MAG: 30S ribosomal protein S11 [Candidatus Shapirobacteria bacterium RBG_13_44_7]
METTKKKVYKNVAEGRLYVKSSFNNTIISVTDLQGNVLTWSSSGHAGFKGARKSTPFAASTALEKCLESAKKFGLKKLSVYFKGPGVGRDATLRYLRAKKDFDIDSISDITPIPHNGPRPPKARRI